MTKSDVAKPAEMKGALQSAFNELVSKKTNHIALPVVHTVSSKTFSGIDTLMLIIAELNSYKWANPFAPQDFLKPSMQNTAPSNESNTNIPS